MNKIHTLWRDINASLWFVPTLMVASAMLLAYGLVTLDLRIDHAWAKEYPLLFGAGASGARGVLTTIAGSMMMVASLDFSLTLSTLGQVSSQYTSRVLRNFMSSRVNQLVLGYFRVAHRRAAGRAERPVQHRPPAHHRAGCGLGVRQLVDIALKALSTGINDTSTAVMCIDYLGALVASLAARRFADPLRTDDGGPVRVITVQPSFATLVNTAFDQILTAGEDDPAVYVRLLTAIDTAASRTHAPARRAVLHAHATRVAEATAQALPTAYDRAQVQARAREVLPRFA